MTAAELAGLLRRDLLRLADQIGRVPEEILFATLPGVTNSCGNLAMHLEGNLREYIGRQLGGVAYVRERPLEFAGKDVGRDELERRVREVAELVPGVVDALTPDRLAAVYPENVLGTPMTVGQFLIHLYGHLNYHLGQIDYLRRLLPEEPSSSSSTPASA